VIPRADELRLQRVEADAERSSKPVEIPDFADPKFPEQAAYVNDPSQLIMLLCTRRAGKSLGVGRRLYKAALKRPGSSCLYIALTRDSAKKIMWKDVLKPLNKQFRLGAKFNETNLTVTLPNGSVIYLLGVDTTEEEKEKLLGQRYVEVAIDEAASFSIDLHALVYGILKPAVADFRGTICLVGTPGNLKRGIYFELTNGQNPCNPGTWQKSGWSGHRWDTTRNPYMRENWLAEIEELKANNPGIEQTPLFQQHYLGLWVIDESKLVYRYQIGRNDFDGKLPEILQGGWHFVLGVDLGFDDASSFTLGAYHDHDRRLFLPESHKKSQMDITDVATEIKRYGKAFDLDRTIVDGANKQAVEEMRKRHELALHAADKTGKADFIDIMNAEFIQARILLGPDAAPLREEYAGLIWDERGLEKGKREEHPNCSNHCADGALYLWRYCYQYLSQVIVPPPKQGSPEWQRAQLEEMRNAAIHEMESRRAALGLETEGVGDSSNWESGW
jgi:hypothetical protein